MENEIDQIASSLGALPRISPEIHKELERLSKQPYILLPKVKSCHVFLEECRLGRAHGRIVGDSGVGKTVSAKAYVKRLAEVSTEINVIYTVLDPNCTSKGFYEKILEALGFTYTKGSIKFLRDRACQVLSRRQVSMLFIDEASFLKMDTLGELIYLEESDVVPSIFLIGTDRLDTLLGGNEQVSRRYPRYQYGRIYDEELKNIVDLWEQKVLKLPVKSNLKYKTKLNVIAKATSGCLGEIDQLLRRAARKALILGESKINLDVLKEVAGYFE
jgi:DNA transposition AAA+ family ATPase